MESVEGSVNNQGTCPRVLDKKPYRPVSRTVNVR
ncbi:hypothetical protein JBW_00318 [Pelosinus fermentans JBW45]|uniref:Uncharacterized protein n=1 Tax=Pelosinus fermentans JBW45 TaxID=1192197 RepID=I9DA09_9FIRM|nr:hypothetical protein JBW_00318 [Pelosinus fermentans JBW45]